MSPADHKPLPPLAVLVLGLVIERPMHPYDMVQTAVARREDRLAPIRAGSLYHAVARLEAQGHIQIHDVVRDGNRPERTVYAITEQGRTAYRAAVTGMLGTAPAEYPQLFMALALAHDLPRERAAELLTARIESMKAEQRDLQGAHDHARAKGVPEMFFLDGGCRLATLATQIDWLTDLVHRLHTGQIGWLDDPGFETQWRMSKEEGFQYCAPRSEIPQSDVPQSDDDPSSTAYLTTEDIQ
ncbi:helix-turn-helix transcriptional regulator [Gordonia sp. TBRC 11910]|uniref:Helix-turn-helix transcriptional regulator n=1 Tax=Gordonia asplenii TaxID=2725283 RepID=A0A848KRY0_9ACTN|nr:PadR family transcriptional regulator [Gordonia asplenii]NMO01180.1 helix-turn-helix transcriptional regulator [Gordonia asplenii]